MRDASLGTPTRANNILVKSFMRKYDGVAKSGAACTVVAGMDYNGIEYYSEASMLGAINPLAGLLGAAVKNKQAAGSSKKFGQGSPCDAIDWGAKNGKPLRRDRLGCQKQVSSGLSQRT